MAIAEDFTHFDQKGNARMVNVGAKEETKREAVAAGRVLVNQKTFRLIQSGGMKKGDVLTVAQIAGIMGASIKNAIIAIVVVSWTKYARLARSLVLKIRDRDYVSAAIVTGSKTPYMLLRYMLPNALPTLIITAATDVGSMMLELAAMSFLGFGAKPPAPEWGYMLNEGRACMQSAPWLMIFPGLAIFIVVVVFNMLGDSIRDILDPKSE